MLKKFRYMKYPLYDEVGIQARQSGKFGCEQIIRELDIVKAHNLQVINNRAWLMYSLVVIMVIGAVVYGR